MKLKKTLRAELLAEELNNRQRRSEGLADESFKLDTQRQQIYYQYAVYKLCEEDIPYEEFINRMDDPEFREPIEEWMLRDVAERIILSVKKKAGIEAMVKEVMET